ncbi:MAG: hypothetical protein KAJ44_01655 [Thermoplasmatales archaeon]|nr:hypothetical protein [Thermoplasmatales archaeon]
MPTYKMKKLTIDNLETFKPLGDYIFVSGNEVTVHDDKLYNDLSKAVENSKLITSLKEENTQLKEKQTAMQIVITERDSLKEQLTTALKDKKPSSEYQGQLDQYKSEISKLKVQGDKQLSQIQELTKQIQGLKNDNQVLQKNNQGLKNDKKSLQASNKKLSKSTGEHEDIKDIFNRWGTYQSLQKDIAIIKLFMEKPNQEIRQKTIIERFMYMDKTTVRLHLYKLVRKGILKEPQFKGSYQLNTDNDDDSLQGIATDVDRIARLILGEKLYEMAVSQHQQKNEQYEN